MNHHITLKQHKLNHISELHMNEDVFTHKFASECSMANCNADCCNGGVWVDIQERSNILEHEKIIQRHMDFSQGRNSKLWFEDRVVNDIDFPSGKAVGTTTNERGCAFLMNDGKCVLQVAAQKEGMHRFALKPFYCVAYPIAIELHELIIDDLDYAQRPQCCGTIHNGNLDIVDVCAEELEFMLGDEGLKELLSIRKALTPATKDFV